MINFSKLQYKWSKIDLCYVWWMARLCPVFNAKIRHTQIENCTIPKYHQQNQLVGVYEHVFRRCQTIRSAQKRLVTLEHHTTDSCVWLLSISLILCWKMWGYWARVALTCQYARSMQSLFTWNWLCNEMIRMLMKWWVLAWKNQRRFISWKLVRQIAPIMKVLIVDNDRCEPHGVRL
jgi:hypothetical protein